MADHHLSAAASADTLVEEREDVMHPPNGGNPTCRNAHFLKPIFNDHYKHLPPPPCSLVSSKPTFEKINKCQILSYKVNPSEKWKIWVNSLKPRYQDIWKQAGIYEAILASNYTIPKDKNLIIGLAERWCAETNTFIFPWGEVSITLEDVLVLGNYSVLGASLSTPLADEYVHILNCLKKAHKKCCRNPGRNVTASVWMKYFMCGGNQLEHEAFLAMWLSKFVFVCTFDHIAVRNFDVAIHLSRGNRIALAPHVLASIYRDMRLLQNSVVGSVVDLRFFICHSDLVHMWAWERFANLRPTPSVMERGEPRSARWNRVKIMNVKDVRAALDSGKEYFMWRPYSIASNNCILSKLYRDYEQWAVVDSDDTESFARCLRVSELVGLGCIEQYLPHRVAMQFGYDQDVPPCVIRSNQSPETAWISYNRPIRGMKLYIPPRLFESDVSSGYMVWWRGLLGVNGEMLTSCIQNEKHLPLVSCRYKSDVKPLAPPSCADERSEDYVEEEDISIAELMRRSRKTKNSGKRFDLDNEPILNTYYGVETPTNSICRNEPVESSVRSRSFSGKFKNSKSPAQRPKEPKPEEDAVVSKTNYYTEANTVSVKDSTTSEVPQVKLKTLDVPGRPSEFVKESQENILEEDSLTITQLLNRSKNEGDGDNKLVLNADPKEVALVSGLWKCTNEFMELNKQSMSSSGKCKKSKSSTEKPIDLEEDAVASKAIHYEVDNSVKDSTTSEVPQVKLKTLDVPGCPSEFVKESREDILEEDSLTITQLLSRSRNRGDGDNKLVLNADSKEVALVSGIWKYTNKFVELNKQSMSSSGKCKKSKSSTENPIDLEEDAIASKDIHYEVNSNNIALANDEVVSKASCPEYNIVSSDNTTSELPELGLEARIWRLEKIFDIIKAEILTARSREF